MAQQASALSLNHQVLRSAIGPEQYAYLLRADDLELAVLAGSDDFLRVRDVRDARQKAECGHILDAQISDPQCTAIIAVVRELTGRIGGTKRPRPSPGPVVHFPKTDQAGKKINQGPGGDLSFLPAAHPVICKQSCKYTVQLHEGDWSSTREVRPMLQCSWWWVMLSGNS